MRDTSKQDLSQPQHLPHLRHAPEAECAGRNDVTETAITMTTAITTEDKILLRPNPPSAWDFVSVSPYRGVFPSWR